MSRRLKLGSAGLLIVLAVVVLMLAREAHEPEPRVEKTPGTVTGNGDAPDFSMYTIAAPVNWIMNTYPGYTIADYGVSLEEAELAGIRQQDGTFLKNGVYHLIKIKNTGPMRLHWTGYADGNFQILLSYWDNERFIQKDIRDARENRTYTIDIDRPMREEFVYVLVNCTSGRLFTDAVRIEPITGRQTP
jgi:hypothetical protein